MGVQFSLAPMEVRKKEMVKEKRCIICGKEATYVCRMATNTLQKGAPRYMCEEHKHVLENEGEYICEEVRKK